MSQSPTTDQEFVDELEQGTADGPRCPHCGAPNSETVCRKCGYYALLGTVIDLADWDREGEPDAPPEAPSHFQVWMNLVPYWAWLIGACILAVLAESLAAAFLFPEDSLPRMRWSLTQLVLGFLVATIIHIVAFVGALMDNADTNLMDIVLRPVSLWKSVAAKLPGSWWRFAVAAAGLTAVLGSLLIIRSLPYDRLWEWGPRKKAEANLMGAIAQQAQKVAGEDKALDEAVKDFAGEALPQEAAEKPAEKRIHVECLVVGYTTRKGNSRRFASLVVAADVGGKLKIVGFVSGGIPNHIRADLDTRLRQLSRQKPFVESELLAHWVEPVVTCEVSCKRRTASGHLIEPVFERLLQEVELGR